jgi:hypothetical protein
VINVARKLITLFGRSARKLSSCAGFAFEVSFMLL